MLKFIKAWGHSTVSHLAHKPHLIVSHSIHRPYSIVSHSARRLYLTISHLAHMPHSTISHSARMPHSTVSNLTRRPHLDIAFKRHSTNACKSYSMVAFKPHPTETIFKRKSINNWLIADQFIISIDHETLCQYPYLGPTLRTHGITWTLHVAYLLAIPDKIKRTFGLSQTWTHVTLVRQLLKNMANNGNQSNPVNC